MDVQPLPTHPQFAAPLHATVHPPPEQLVILQLCVPWQVSLQSPPGQSIAHEPPVHAWMQSPPGQFIEQEPPVQV